MKNSKTRKYQLTINNPVDCGFTHEKINEIFDTKIKYQYYCMCDEIGEKGTYHTHIYFVTKNAMLFSTVKKLFPEAHIEPAKGTNSQNRDYIRKEGKYLSSEKKETNIPETFEEYGEMPLDREEKDLKACELVIELVKQGKSNTEIIEKVPSWASKVPHIEKLRQEYLKKEFENEFRNVTVHYIYGKSRTGKTRYVMDKYGYSNVLKTTNYKNPFDLYEMQSVLLLDEFRGQLPLSDLLQYLDGYPCYLPARYSDRLACYTEVYIVSNVPLDSLYKDVQIESKDSWNAFVKRIDTITKFELNDENLPFSTDNVVMIEEFPEDYLL